MWASQEASLRGVSRAYFANPLPDDGDLRLGVAAIIAERKFGRVVELRSQVEHAGITFHDLVRAETALPPTSCAVSSRKALLDKVAELRALKRAMNVHSRQSSSLRLQRRALTQLLKAVMANRPIAGKLPEVPDLASAAPKSASDQMAAAAPMSPKAATAKREREGRIGVTVLSGFLGSGKTTLLSRLLNESHGKRLAVIVNDMSELNLDARAAGKLVQAEQKLVAMQNGCICCTLREDLLEEVAKLARSGHFDYLVIESTGIAEPLPVAETFSFDSEGACLSDLARLDTMVTLVDAHSFLHDLDTLESLDERGWEEEQEDAEQHVSTLLVEQIEFANVVIVNKCDLVSEAEAARVEAAVRGLNPDAKVIRATKAAVPLDAVMDTGLFSMEKASKAAGWLKEARGEHVPETAEYGISSFVFRSTRPFHPGRLGLLLESRAFSSGTSSRAPIRGGGGAGTKPAPPSTAAAGVEADGDEEDDDAALMAEAASEPAALQAAMRGEYGFVIRSKGIAWLAGSAQGSNSFAGEWSHAGRRVSLTPTGRWMASVPEADRPTDEEFVRSWSDAPGVGDRCNEVVVIAFDLKVDEFRGALQACQVTDAEWEAGPEAWAKLEDPIWGDVDWEALAEALAADAEDEDEVDEDHSHPHHHHHGGQGHGHALSSEKRPDGDDREPESKRAASSSPVSDSA